MTILLVWFVAVLLSPELYAQSADSVEAIPFKASEVDIGGLLIRAIFSLAILSALAIGGLVLVRKYLPALGLGLDTKVARGKRIKLLEIKRLNPKATLFLVEVEGRTMLLGQGDGLRLLDNSDASNVASDLTGAKTP